MNDQVQAPKWFKTIAIILIIWNVMGVMSFFQHISMTGEALQALPQEEQDLYARYPAWTTFVFALAVFAGLGGSIALLLKRKVAYMIFVVSLVAVMIQMGHSLFVAGAMSVYGPAALVMPILVAGIGVYSIWLSKQPFVAT